MKHCKLLSIDLAKTVFQLCAMDIHNHIISNKKVRRKQLIQSVLEIKPETIVMESCYSANYWGREFQSMGFKVNLIPPQHVKPFVKTNKNDHHDAVAICEASLRPGIHFVPVKTIEQQDIQGMHRIRERLVRNRTAIVNQIRGLLAEYGVIINRSYRCMRTQLPLIIEDMDNKLSFIMRDELNELYEELITVQERIKSIEQRLENISGCYQAYKSLKAIPGIGPITSSAFISQVGDAKQFKSARSFAAWLGLTPKHRGSGTKTINQGMFKRGNKYLRKLLIHGGRLVIFSYKQDDVLKRFADRINERRGIHKASVAVVHKMARIIWAVLSKNEPYNPEHVLKLK